MITKPKPKEQPTVALVLGSGGARGYAHIGVIRELEARGYDIIGVSGCSMGAVIGGFYAAGKLQEYTDWVQSLTYLDVLKLVDFSFLTNGAISGDRLFNHLGEMLGPINIEELSMPYTAVATELSRQKEIWFERGPLNIAMRASTAIPSLLKPVVDNGRLLVDGAVLNPLPIAPVMSVHADYIIAVDASADVPMPENWNKPIDPEDHQNEKKQWLGGVLDKIGGLWGTSEKSTEEAMYENLGKLGVIYEMFETMQMALTHYKIAGYPPDVLVNVPTSSIKMYEFYRAKEQIELGQHMAQQALNQFEKKH